MEKVIEPDFQLENKRFRILVVDDEENVLKLIYRFLLELGYTTETTVSGLRAVEKVKEKGYDLILLDLRLPDMNGLEVLKKIKKADRNVSVLMMTGHGKVETAVKAMKLGADDYLLKPFKSLDALAITINKIKEYRELKAECFFLKEQLNDTYKISNIIGKSRSMTNIFKLIRKVAPLNSSVLVEGESGTGKELIARAIHQNSTRNKNNFVPINCGAIPVNLLESELFGYERGAFTGAVCTKRGYFEVANKGTIFLDEISEMDKSLQVKLLRLIQEKKFQRIGGTEEMGTDVRIITSTNRDLDKEVLKKNFRKDLYYRINVIRVRIPPLRERREDIPLLTHSFLDKYSQEFKKDVSGISPKVMTAFFQYRWDGNVRELENVVEHAVAMAEGHEITPKDLPERIIDIDTGKESNPGLIHFDEAKRQFEQHYIEKVLELTGGNIAEASRMSSIPRQNIYEKIKKYSISPARFR